MITPACPNPVAHHDGFRWSAGATLVIGYGNELRGDDGAGVRAATRIAARFSQSCVIVAQQLTPDLADDIANAAQVVFIDACAANGHGAKLRIERVFGGGLRSVLGHYGDPADLLCLAKRLHGRTADAWVVGIPAYCFAAGGAISPATARWIDDAVALFGE